MSAKAWPIAKFRLGKIVFTPSALDQLSQDDILLGIQRHQAGDWGDVDEHDRTRNELSLTQGLRLWSVYHAGSGVKFWLITEAGAVGTGGNRGPREGFDKNPGKTRQEFGRCRAFRLSVERQQALRASRRIAHSQTHV
jgi:hypothetical protein